VSVHRDALYVNLDFGKKTQLDFRHESLQTYVDKIVTCFLNHRVTELAVAASIWHRANILLH